jgi:hypothetical protein
MAPAKERCGDKRYHLRERGGQRTDPGSGSSPRAEDYYAYWALPGEDRQVLTI